MENGMVTIWSPSQRGSRPRAAQVSASDLLCCSTHTSGRHSAHDWEIRRIRGGGQQTSALCLCVETDADVFANRTARWDSRVGFHTDSCEAKERQEGAKGRRKSARKSAYETTSSSPQKACLLCGRALGQVVARNSSRQRQKTFVAPAAKKHIFQGSWAS